MLIVSVWASFCRPLGFLFGYLLNTWDSFHTTLCHLLSPASQMGASGCLRLLAALIEWCRVLIKHNAAEFHHDQFNLSCLAWEVEMACQMGNAQPPGGGLQWQMDRLRIAESEWQDGWMEDQFTPGLMRNTDEEKMHCHISTCCVLETAQQWICLL